VPVITGSHHNDSIGTCLPPLLDVQAGSDENTADTVWTRRLGFYIFGGTAAHFAGMDILKMKNLLSIGAIACCLLAFASLAGADSLQLRNGRHLQGKYIGGSSTAIGFMTAGTLEYFLTSEVLSLVFDSTSDFPMSGLRPNPMKGHPAKQQSVRARVQQTSLSTTGQGVKLDNSGSENTKLNTTVDRQTSLTHAH